MTHRAIFFSVLLASSALAAPGCDDPATTTVANNPSFQPGNADGDKALPSVDADAGGVTTDGGCPNKPAGCFCGTPTTQQQWLNRCTNAAALPVNLTVKPASTTNIP